MDANQGLFHVPIKQLKTENVENGSSKFHILILKRLIFGGFMGLSLKKKIGK